MFMPAGDCEAMELVIAGFVAFLLLVYLVWTLIRPENF
jgi:K+-transporting ATPase KdpF subunit